MKVAVLSHGLPQPSSLGGPMTAWAVLAQLAAEGHDATVLALRYPGDPFYSAEREQAVEETAAGLVVIPVGPEHELRSPAGTVELRAGPGLERIFPTAGLRPRVEEALRAARPEAIFAYHWDTLAASHRLLRRATDTIAGEVTHRSLMKGAPASPTTGSLYEPTSAGAGIRSDR